MSTVWVLSSGEKYEGEQIVAIYESWHAAVAALVQMGIEDYEGEPVHKVIDETATIAIVQDGPFYSIVRPHEVIA